MCLTLPQTLITVMGIEKLLPTFTDLEVFLQLLPRSSTGERMNPYTSLWTGRHPRRRTAGIPPDPAGQRPHQRAGRQVGRAALHCIRCSACLNVCPVYTRTGGHAYGSVYPGPIGAVLTPQLTGMQGHDDPNSSLPYASSLCGACYDVCPVKIDIPSLLVELRAQGGRRRPGPHHPRRLGRRDEGRRLGDERREAFRRSGKGSRRSAGCSAGRKGRIRHLPPPLSAWTGSRDLPAPPAQTFRDWWKNAPDATASRRRPSDAAATPCWARIRAALADDGAGHRRSRGTTSGAAPTTRAASRSSNCWSTGSSTTRRWSTGSTAADLPAPSTPR